MKVYAVVFNDDIICKIFGSRKSAVKWIDLQERWWEYRVVEMTVED